MLLWNRQTGSIFKSFPSDQPITRAVFSPDGTLVAAGDNTGKITLWNIATSTGLRVLEGYPSPISALAFAPDGRTLMSGDERGVITEWDTWNRENRSTWETFNGSIFTIDVKSSPDGLNIFASTHDSAEFDEIPDELTASYTGIASAFSPDGKTLLISREGVGAGEVAVYDAETATQIRTLLLDASARAVAFSPDGQFLLTGDDAGKTILWRASTGVALSTQPPFNHAITVATFSPDGGILATGGCDSIRLVNIYTSQWVQTLRSTSGSVTYITFSPDSQTLLSLNDDGRVRLWPVDALGNSSEEPAVENTCQGETHDILTATADAIWRATDASFQLTYAAIPTATATWTPTATTPPTATLTPSSTPTPTAFPV